MCITDLTKCIECNRWIDSELDMCPARVQASFRRCSITVHGQTIGYCPYSGSVDSYGIDANGQPHNWNRRFRLGDYVLRRHRWNGTDAICIWCRHIAPADEIDANDRYRKAGRKWAYLYNAQGTIYWKAYEIGHTQIRYHNNMLLKGGKVKHQVAFYNDRAHPKYYGRSFEPWQDKRPSQLPMGVENCIEAVSYNHYETSVVSNTDPCIPLAQIRAAFIRLCPVLEAVRLENSIRYMPLQQPQPEKLPTALYMPHSDFAGRQTPGLSLATLPVAPVSAQQADVLSTPALASIQDYPALALCTVPYPAAQQQQGAKRSHGDMADAPTQNSTMEPFAKRRRSSTTPKQTPDSGYYTGGSQDTDEASLNNMSPANSLNFDDHLGMERASSRPRPLPHGHVTRWQLTASPPNSGSPIHNIGEENAPVSENTLKSAPAPAQLSFGQDSIPEMDQAVGEDFSYGDFLNMDDHENAVPENSLVAPLQTLSSGEDPVVPENTGDEGNAIPMENTAAPLQLLRNEEDTLASWQDTLASWEDNIRTSLLEFKKSNEF